MTKCSRCNRPLKREPYASIGMGKICLAKSNSEKGNNQNTDSDNDTIVPYDGGDFFIERLEALTDTPEGTRMQKHSCSGIRTNIQRTIYRHSPTGFNFGYGGSGPADTALNLLLMVTSKEEAEKYYKDFKWRFLGKDVDKLVITVQEITDYLTEKRTGNPADSSIPNLETENLQQ